MKKAFITGITGQDGSYLTELLLEKGYEVHGMARKFYSYSPLQMSKNTGDKNLHIHNGNLMDNSSLIKLIYQIQPDEIYNLGAQSNVGASFDNPEYTINVNGVGTLRILEAIKNLGFKNKTKFYQASTCELFGHVRETPQNENTAFYPRNPYSISKLYAYWITKNYREAHKLYSCNGILFNHDSPRRGKEYVTRKISLATAKIFLGLQEKLYLGNLNATRDWGYAPDYVEAMWKMLQLQKPDDFVIATGEAHSVREFVEEAFKNLEIKIKWVGKGVSEKGIDTGSGKILVEVNPDFFRPVEVEFLVGDPSRAEKELNWTPKIKFKELVKIMVEADLNILKKRFVN